MKANDAAMPGRGRSQGEDLVQMPAKEVLISSFQRLRASSSSEGPRRRGKRARPGLQLGPEILEMRLAPSTLPSTYVWIARGDQTSWNDPNNWSHFGPDIGIPLTGTPTRGSNIVFPPVATLPSGSPATINFNFPDLSFPINSLAIEDSYTFQGNPVTIQNSVFVVNPFGGLTDATILLGELTLARDVSISTARGSTLDLGSAATPTGLQLNLTGGVTKTGGGQLVLDTQNVFDPAPVGLQPFEIAGGTVTIGTSADFSGTKFLVDSGSSLVVVDNAQVKVGSIAGSGGIDLEGTGAPADQTSLTAVVPIQESDAFSGSIQGAGQFIKNGNGVLATGPIQFGDAGSIQVLLGTLDVDGSISAGTLQVGNGATFGGVGRWFFSGPAVFQAGSTFAVTLDGLAAGTQYTQLQDTDAATGIELGGATLAATVGYEYQAGDPFTIVTGPRVAGQFQNVGNGFVLLGGNVPFAVAYSSTAAQLTALQSETTTQLSGAPSPSNPGQEVTFTASVSTRTAPVATGTVSFRQGSTVTATIPVSGSGLATYTTAALPLGSTTITAVFSGAAGILGSSSPGVTQTVVPYTTSTSLASTANPSLPGEDVTFSAAVRASGTIPVTEGTVSFTRGNQLLGTVALGGDGSARLTVSTLPIGQGRIQAVYNGSLDNLSSLSPGLVQSVDRFATTTTLTLATQLQPNGRVRYVLVSAVAVEGPAGATAAGTVVFRRNGRVIGRVRLTGGTASIALGRRLPAQSRFVAAYQGGPLFRASSSPAI
jgi:hypothetical protein